MKSSTSLRTRLSMIFAVLLLALILVLGSIIGYRSVKQAQLQIGSSLAERAYLMGNTLDQYMWSRYGEIEILSTLKELRQPDDIVQVQNLLDQSKTIFPSFSWIGYTNAEGTVTAATDGILEGVDISERPVYQGALTDKFIGDVHEAVLLADLLPNPTGEKMKFVDISLPVHDYENNFIGVLATHLSWEWMVEIEASMKKTVSDQESIEFFIVSKENNDVLLGPEEMVGLPLNTSSIEQAKINKNGWTLEKWDDGKQYLTGYLVEEGYKDYPGLGWTVLVRQPLDVAYAPIKELLAFILVSGVLLVLVFAGLGWIVAGYVARPLKQITGVADRLREGEPVEIPSYKGILEIEVLSESLRKLVSNLTQTETALERMEDVAYHDALTGLPNRNALDQFLDGATEKYNKLVVLYIDLDGYKAINDTYGHHAGDELLKQVAARLKRNVGNEELVSRVGGDEFVVVLTSANATLENGRAVGERIVAMLNKPYIIEGEILSIGCSIGGAVWDAGQESISDVIRQADEALYSVKRTGKNRVDFNEAIIGA
ncbi:sensor domain-containing diguanylate cyclase [Planomicrobium sp. CPCC 101079]|uniref:sensor domain-containing diguanylate cyclase n=1 Tax=Planomicrobium sp. CPCC 101079 TaxID=2599618 RepID=UPI0011B35992|nr:sensor domain-containing diguanylate cyclase [Planomicrobium sp. CPCC 101079]TWT03660.1 diguanylate cyclase [Planomicrobium sp. CPCC 101079]